jgi:hypothetical protein
MRQPAHHQFVDWPFMFARVSGQYPKHFSEQSICPREFARHQNRSTERHLIELIWQCRDRFVFSHWLHNPHELLPEVVYGRPAIVLDGFYLGWSRICSAYRRLLFDAQMDMFSNQRDRELRRWRGFLEEQCFSRFSRDLAHACCVLETACIMPKPAEHRHLTVDALFDNLIHNMEETYVGLVGGTFTQPVDRGLFVAESFEELERELGSVKRLLRKVGYGVADFYGVHSATLSEPAGLRQALSAFQSEA